MEKRKHEDREESPSDSEDDSSTDEEDVKQSKKSKLSKKERCVYIIVELMVNRFSIVYKCHLKWASSSEPLYFEKLFIDFST